MIEDYCRDPGENLDIGNINRKKQNGKERINLRVIKGVIGLSDMKAKGLEMSLRNTQKLSSQSKDGSETENKHFEATRM